MDKFEEILMRQKEFEQEQSEINKSYLSSNIIFHYTKLETALDYILPELTLRLPSKENANKINENDPFENQLFIPDRGGMLPLDGKERQRFRERQSHITDIIQGKIHDDIRLISFCTNDNNKQGIDSLGFNKPRMWAQYGDNFRGVCLAFNIEKLVGVNKLSLDENVFIGKIMYSDFSQIFENKPMIHNHDLYSSNDDSLVVSKIIKREIRNIIFTKHKDYQDENEYRICRFKEGNDDSYLDISNSIVGIIVNSHAIEKTNKQKLFAYAEKLNFVIIENDWADKNLSNWHIKPPRRYNQKIKADEK